ncbi:uncharacterized protein LOC111412495 [Olea europaea var. sylvestris]|uniref:uncharacterized protein LOC111412495 n=1 Tax=Olea europaea var. sylvestris TaxID=158386 RepID=UPI000C1CEEF3|nr:uncharacterized protein LOC111412495 [Olea europaea var. sylvestris]
MAGDKKGHSGEKGGVNNCKSRNCSQYSRSGISVLNTTVSETNRCPIIERWSNSSIYVALTANMDGNKSTPSSCANFVIWLVNLHFIGRYINTVVRYITLLLDGIDPNSLSLALVTFPETWSLICNQQCIGRGFGNPGLRTPIVNYNVNVRDEIRRAYVQRGPCQPRNHKYPQKEFGDLSLRRFKSSWFNDFLDWLEHSIEKDALFCFYCYFFKSNSEEHGGGDAFVDGGFSNWKKKRQLRTHSKRTKDEYRVRLNASIDCVRLLLQQGLSFRGNDESEDSRNHGNFLELLKWLCDHNNETKASCLKNAPENLQLTSPSIQKDIVSAIAFETLDIIMKDIGDGLFSILVDESCDVSVKEQMSIVLRYVNKKGKNPCGFYIHCFAHQLQLALLIVAKKHAEIEMFFTLVNKLVNVVRGLTKRCDLLREKKRLEVVESLNFVDVIEMIATDATSFGHRGKARILLGFILTFDFVFSLHLMKWVLGISDEHNIDVPNMDDMFIPLGPSRGKTQGITNLHHFRVDFFYAIIDLQIQELNDRFSEVFSNLLLCIACLCLENSFFAFNKDKLITLLLILLVATATVERVFSAIKIVKNRLRNQMGD